MGEPNVAYEPNKLRSRPLRCIWLPILATFLFILYWFCLCPLLYVALRRMNFGWTHYWHYYYWAVAFLVFLLILGLLVLLWRKKCKSCPHPAAVPVSESPSDTKALLKVDVAEEALRSEEIDKNIKALEKKLDVEITKVNINTDEIKVYSEKEQVPTVEPEAPTKSELSGFVRNDLQRTDEPVEPSSSQPPSNLDRVSEETKVELHSPAYPLTPREIFFWDLIQSANKNDSVKFNFDESDKGIESGEDSTSNKDLIRSDEESVGEISQEVQDGSFTSSTVPVEVPDEPRMVEDEPLLKKESPPLSVSDASLRMRRTIPSVHIPSDTQYFIANVSERKNETSEAYLYVDGGADRKYYRIRMDNPDCV
ncbi:uncharacterized protein LOC116159081 [Photinus pyralis]|nr:uncharacterized protein LOC116159081 [Photinus pyralis]